MTTLHGGYDYLVISVHFIFYLDKMSAVINPEVILKDVRATDIETMKNALSLCFRFDQSESNLMNEIYNRTMSKLYENNANELQQYTEFQLHFLQTDLLLKIAKKVKLLTMSLEEYVSHDALVNANFHYDIPQQRIYDEMQSHLNLMATSNAVEQITNP